MTNLLSAPAIFFWGVATSDIGEDSLSWSKSTSAAALAVVTIVIPGLDAFYANPRVEQWLDEVTIGLLYHFGFGSNTRCGPVDKNHPPVVGAGLRVVLRYILCTIL